MSNLSTLVRVIVGPFAVAFAVSLALVPVCRWVALRFGYVSQPREDRWHRRPIPMFGGVAIGLTLLVGVLAFDIVPHLPVLLGCAAAIFVMGLTDDIFSLKPSTKLVIEIAVASVFIFMRFRLNWTTSLTVDMMLTLVWIVGMTNAFNLLDNMDGLCAGIALVVGATLLLGLPPAAVDSEAFYQARYLAILLGATSGFLVYNFHPASVFMGDSGALLLGLSCAALTLTPGTATVANANPLSIIAAPVLVLLIPIFDTSLVTVSRILSGRAPSEGGRDHSSHRLVAIGLSERAAVALLWLLAAAGGALGIAVDYLNVTWSGLVASLFLIAMTIFAVYLARVRVYEEVPEKALEDGSVTAIVADFTYKRRVAEVLLDVCLVTLAYYTAYRLRFEGGDEFKTNFTTFYRSLPLVLGTQMIAFFAVGIYRGIWRYFGLMDTIVVAKGVVVGTVCSQLAILYVLRFEGFSRTVFVIYAVVIAILLTVSRASFRLLGEALHRSRNAATRTVVYGAGDGGSLVVRELMKAPDAHYRILGFVDDDTRKQRIRVQGFPVLGGFDSLVSLVENHVIDAVVVSARIMSLDRMEELAALCRDHGVSLSRLHVGFEPLIAVGRDPIVEVVAPAPLQKNVS